MREKDSNDTFKSIQEYLATGRAKSSPARPTLKTGLPYYRHNAADWLWDRSWFLWEMTLLATGAVISNCLEVAERIALITGRNDRITHV